MTANIILGLIAAIIIGVFVAAIYGEIQYRRKLRHNNAKAVTRAQDFMASLTERQRALHVLWRGQNQTHIILSMEQRIHELEQRLAAFERVTYDDGK